MGKGSGRALKKGSQWPLVRDGTSEAKAREREWERECELLDEQWGSLPDLADETWQPWLLGLVLPGRDRCDSPPGYIYTRGLPPEAVADTVRELEIKGIDAKEVARALAWGRQLEGTEPGFRSSKWKLRAARAELQIHEEFLRILPKVRGTVAPDASRPAEVEALSTIEKAMSMRKDHCEQILRDHRSVGPLRRPMEVFTRGGPVDVALKKLGVPDYHDCYHNPPGPQLRSKLLDWQRDAAPSGINALSFCKPRSGQPTFPDHFWALIPRHERRLKSEGRTPEQLAFPIHSRRGRKKKSVK